MSRPPPVDLSLLEVRAFQEPDRLAAEAFTCGDDDLDDFLRSDALRLAQQRVATTYVAFYRGEMVGYVALLADAVKLSPRERKKLTLNHDDHPVVPALKVARLGVCQRTRESLCSGIGKHLMRFAAYVAMTAAETHGCRLLTVDAYPAAIGFYTSLGFVNNADKEHCGKANPSMRFDLFAATPASWLS